MGSIARAPFGVISKAADPVLYPAAAAAAAAPVAAAAGAEERGGVAEGDDGGRESESEAATVDDDFGLGAPAAYFEASADVRHDSESEHWESAEEGDGDDWPSVAAMTARIENPAAVAELDDAAAGRRSSTGDAGLEDAKAGTSAPREEKEEEATAPAAGGAPSFGSASGIEADGEQTEPPLAVAAAAASASHFREEASREAKPSPTALRSAASLADAETSPSPPREEEDPKAAERGILGRLFGRTSSKAAIEVS